VIVRRSHATTTATASCRPGAGIVVWWAGDRPGSRKIRPVGTLAPGELVGADHQTHAALLVCSPPVGLDGDGRVPPAMVVTGNPVAR
jgi:hypothetical protein